MEFVLNWIKRLLYFSVFLTVFMQLLPGESYKKYVRFFAGILLIILAVNPILTFLSKEDFADEILETMAVSEEKVDMELDVDELWQAQQKYYRRQAEKSVEDVVKEQADQMDIAVKECDIVWSEDGEQIRTLTVKIVGGADQQNETGQSGADEPGQSESESDRKSRDNSMDISPIDIDRTVIDQIKITTGRGKEENDDKEAPSDSAQRLKKELMQTFELAEDQIFIMEA